jgi:hypothetical protein
MHRLSSSEHSTMVDQHVLHRSAHTLDGYRRLLRIRSFVSKHGAVHYDQELLAYNDIDEYSVSSMRMCTLYQSIEDLWNAMSSMMKHGTEGISRLQNNSRKFDLSKLSSWKAVAHAPLEAILAMTEERL